MQEAIIIILGIYSFGTTLWYFLTDPKTKYIRDHRISIGFMLDGIYFLWNGDRLVTSKMNNKVFGNLTIWNRGLDEVETKLLIDNFKKKL